MKKLLFILAIIAVYGISSTTVNANEVSADKAKITIVADDNAPDGEKAKKAEKKADEGCATKEAAKSGCGEKEKAACAEKGKSCCGSTEAAPVPAKKK